MMKFRGIIPAVVTPLHENETVNVEVLRQLLEHLINKNADGFYIGGATGEGIALKTEERMVLAKEAVAAVNHRKPCIIQVAAADFNVHYSENEDGKRLGFPDLFSGFLKENIWALMKLK